jgi:lipopolysaccharide export system protein LptC
MPPAAVMRTTTLGARRSQSLASARQRSRVVQGLRVVLLVLIAAVMINAAIQLVQQSLAGGDEPSFEPTVGSQRIVNPRFVGRDEAGAPFTITAESAVRREGGLAGVADLVRPTLDYLLVGSDDTSSVLADTGVFDDGAQTLDLGGRVRLTTRSGYAFDTEAARIRLREGEITGDAPVSGTAPWGALRADRFEVYDDGRRIVLSGDVRTRLYMDSSEETQP